jgi:SNF2 family DNA or RNA helicase
MIQVSTHNKTIRVSANGSNAFTQIIATLKQNKCRFDLSRKDWIIPHHKYDAILNQLEDLDTIDMSLYDEEEVKKITRPEPELRIAKERRMFDQSLLRYPPIVGKEPYADYQRVDIVRAIHRNRYGLFLDMGLGKAYYKAAIISHLRKMGLAHKVLLISSNIGASNMVHELKKFMYVDPNEIICMTKAGKDRELFKADKTIAITNYNTFKFICDYYYKQETGKAPTSKKYRKAVLPLKEWFGGKPGILLLDESHNIGNPKSQQTQRIMQHMPLFEYRYLFSGTPADKPEKLYTQLKVLDEALVDGLSYVDWLDEYAELGTRFSAYAIREWKYDKIEALNKRVEQTYGIFRKSEDVLNLPENYIKKLYIDLEPNHRAIYEAFVVNTLSGIQERTGGLLTRDIMNSFPYLQMALDNPNMLLNHWPLLTEELQGMIEKFDFKSHAKSDMLYNILSEHVDEKNEKGIIWIYHPDTAGHLARMYARYNPLTIIGETDDRDKILEKFRTDDSHKLLIASIPILNTSVTLVEAKFQVYFERVYNYNQYSQSLKRINRIGQDRRTITYVLIFSESIDVALDINLTHKDILNTKILSKDFLTMEEWKEIFNLNDLDTSILDRF